ncbi:type VII secretion system-associated protein [Saccharothrix sp. HUAS TT1]|uniref:type VII secretion system-associated protein n=1 Tax=unclassified Saccharothrix TaxID=2593673 RepID=UPI00345B7CEA
MKTDADTENWFLLMDPSWAPETQDEAPPLHAVVGLWPVSPEGEVGRFRTNPSYVPSNPTSPHDPLDAVMRLLLRGEAEVEHLQMLLRDTLYDLAMNGDGRPLVMNSPDDVPCTVVATSEGHRGRVSSPEWRRVDLTDLVELLADGVDVLFNPGGPASVRLAGEFIRRTLVMSEEEVRAAYDSLHDDRPLEVLPWEVPPVDASPADAPLSDASPADAPSVDASPVEAPSVDAPPVADARPATTPQV